MRNALAAAAALAVVLHLGGCDHEPNPASPQQPASNSAVIPTPAQQPSSSQPAPASSPARAPTADQREPASPQQLLQRWQQAMENGDFDVARGYFGQDGAASGMDEEAFDRAWSKYRSIDVTLGDGQIEGAAGSSFYEAPVTVTGVNGKGEPYRLAGTVTARRVNNVPGATPEQLRWHIERTTLRP